MSVAHPGPRKEVQDWEDEVFLGAQLCYSNHSVTLCLSLNLLCYLLICKIAFPLGLLVRIEENNR